MQERNTFLNLAQIIIGLVLSLLLVLFSLSGTLSGFKAVSEGVASGIQGDSYDFFQNLKEQLDFLSHLGETKQQRDDLKDENLALQSRITELETEINDLRSISRQLNFDLPFTLEPVRVIRYDESQIGELIINKGNSSGIKLGDIAVLDKYAVGEVIEVSEITARVRLITSPKSIIPVITLLNSSKGVVVGELGSGVKLKEVLIEGKVEGGELVISSGVNSNFPYGLLIGKVGEVTSVESELTKQAKINLDLNFSTLRDLFIIKK